MTPVIWKCAFASTSSARVQLMPVLVLTHSQFNLQSVAWHFKTDQRPLAIVCAGLTSRVATPFCMPWTMSGCSAKPLVAYSARCVGAWGQQACICLFPRQQV